MVLDPIDFIDRVEFRDAALLSFVTSAIIVPAYDTVKRETGITRAEYLLLLCLSHFPALTAQDVSRLTGRPRNSISRAVHRMLEDGYLTRSPDPNDGRQVLLRITDKGRKLHSAIVPGFIAREQSLLNVLSDEVRFVLDRLLMKLVAQVID